MGESGCGKSTLGRLCWADPFDGEIRAGMKYSRNNHRNSPGAEAVFQDPSALVPGRSATMEPLLAHGMGKGIISKSIEMLQLVGG